MTNDSLLYSLAPLGVSSWAVEACTSYIARLSEAHCNLPHHILKILIPLNFERGRNHSKIMRRISERPWLLNRDGVFAEGFVRALETATHVTDLSNLTINKLTATFDNRYVLKKSAAWCPKCFNQMRETGSHYMPLLWTLGPVTVCPEHQIYLSSQCPHCGSSVSWIKGRYRLGYCDQCFRWLGANFAKAKRIDQKSDWISRQYQTILTTMQSAEMIPLPHELFSAFLLCLANAGKSRLFKEHRERLSMRFCNRLDLDKFIKDLYSAQVEISQVFDRVNEVRRALKANRLLAVLSEDYRQLCKEEEVEAEHSKIRTFIEQSLSIPENNLTFASIERKFDLWKGYVQYYFPDLAERIRERQQEFQEKAYRLIESKLDQTLQKEKGEKSLTAVANDLPKSPLTISNHFPGRTQEIVDAFQSEVHGNLEKRIEAARQEVFTICEALFAEGIYPSQHKVSDRMSQPSLIKNPRVEEARKEFLKEKGLFDLYHDS